MPHTPTDMSKWWTESSCKLCQKLLRLVHKSEISDVPAGCGTSLIFRFCAETNLALNKPVAQSSDHSPPHSDAQWAVNGNLFPFYFGSSGGISPVSC